MYETTPVLFPDLSPEAQNAILDCLLGGLPMRLPEHVKQEIARWAQPNKYDYEELEQ